MLKDPSNTIMAENREQTSQVKRHLQASSILLLSNTTVCVSSLFLLSIVPNEPQQKTSMYIDTKKKKTYSDTTRKTTPTFVCCLSKFNLYLKMR